MDWFKSASVPNTISDQQRDALQRRAIKTETESMFSKRNVAKRLASEEQRSKADQS